jgi:HNH endonuclease/AP2 domain
VKANLANRPSIERIRQVLAYDEASGLLTWRVTSGRAIAGREPGGVDQWTGYHRIRIDGFAILTHHVVFAIVTGKWVEQLDHIDGDKAHYRFENLREANQTQNMGNMGLPKHNKSGVKGVCWHKATGKWIAQITIRRKSKYLGVFDTKEEAQAAYLAAAKEHFGEFACVDRLQAPVRDKATTRQPRRRPTVEEVRAALVYDPETGILNWGIGGPVAGNLKADGYIRIGMHWRHYPAHVLAWVLVKGEWPVLVIHHIDSNRSNNRWANLMQIPQSENVLEHYRKMGQDRATLYKRRKMAYSSRVD